MTDIRRQNSRETEFAVCAGNGQFCKKICVSKVTHFRDFTSIDKLEMPEKKHIFRRRKIANQQKHHKMVNFIDEYEAFVKKNGIKFL